MLQEGRQAEYAKREILRKQNCIESDLESISETLIPSAAHSIFSQDIPP